MPSELYDAAKAVCWFNWDDNDADAVAAIKALRAALAKEEAVEGDWHLTDLSPEWRAEFRADCHQGDEKSKDALRVLDDLERLERTVRFMEKQYLKAHGGSWGKCKYQSMADRATETSARSESRAPSTIIEAAKTVIESAGDKFSESDTVSGKTWMVSVAVNLEALNDLRAALEKEAAQTTEAAELYVKAISENELSYCDGLIARWSEERKQRSTFNAATEAMDYFDHLVAEVRAYRKLYRHPPAARGEGTAAELAKLFELLHDVSMALHYEQFPMQKLGLIRRVDDALRARAEQRKDGTA